MEQLFCAGATCFRLLIRNPAAESADVGMTARMDDDSGSDEETSTSTESGEQEHEQEHEPQEDIDHGLQRFEVLSREPGRRERHSDQFMRAKLEEQETLIARLEEDNLTLREKLYLAEQELKDLRKRATSGDEAENYLSDGEASCAAP